MPLAEVLPIVVELVGLGKQELNPHSFAKLKGSLEEVAERLEQRAHHFAEGLDANSDGVLQESARV